jgi:hypothetical protein
LVAAVEAYFHASPGHRVSTLKRIQKERDADEETVHRCYRFHPMDQRTDV